MSDAAVVERHRIGSGSIAIDGVLVALSVAAVAVPAILIRSTPPIHAAAE